MSEQLASRIQKLESDTGNHIAECVVRNKQQSSTNEDHESRIRALEQVQWKTAGVLSVVCFVASAAATGLMTKLFGE